MEYCYRQENGDNDNMYMLRHKKSFTDFYNYVVTVFQRDPNITK
jgi:hypothetical protein